MTKPQRPPSSSALTLKNVSARSSALLTKQMSDAFTVVVRCELSLPRPFVGGTMEAELTYIFVGGNAIQQEKVKTVVQEWVKCVNVNFTFVVNCNAIIRISIWLYISPHAETPLLYAVAQSH
ncbi:hypothetical protein K443DRAFT_470307 [Laccaria amethystina LaAM-08-1]|uniref:Uncharacterized protein n=1 Tax=Laccaria amethystina LaAM-08-1 TaxID=1095629 RepID=A0A0C9X5L8_9AGAR|nr:hypothetical protein K443DRAFT_470307 [Laccaria amethystina LaAM-08-1]